MGADRAASRVLTPRTEFAGYVIEEMLARGGMGVVYRARDLALDRTVALKVIAPEYTKSAAAVARFTAEAKLAAAIDHPNLVTIYRAGKWEGVLFLAMQFVPGTDLQLFLRVHDSPDLPWIERVVGQVASALDAAHGSGLVHRDVKPANILLSGPPGDEHAYLTDFGITKRLGAATALTRTHEWVGTADYAAPEQIHGRDVDARTDVYALGCVAHEMLTGHAPYEKESPIATLWAHVSDPPPAPCAHRQDLLPVFDLVVAHATAKERGDRFPTAGALAGALSKAVRLQRVSEKQNSVRDTIATTDVSDIAEPASASADPGNAAPAQAPLILPPEHATPQVAEPSAQALAPTTPDPATPTSAKRHTPSRRAVIVGAGGLLAAAAVIAGVLAIGSSRAPHPRPAGNGTTAPSLKQQVVTLDGVVHLFIAGRRLSHVEHNYSAAAANRMRVLHRLDAFHAPPPLRAAARTLRAMTADALLYNQLMAKGETARARAPNIAHDRLRPQFVSEFNPFARRYLRRAYTVGEL